MRAPTLKEICKQNLAIAELEMRRSLHALQLEVHEDVWKDVNKKFEEFSKAAWEAHNRVRVH